ncbi:glycoside hydrolase family 16 protein [uncultured Sunxiuqinia sp.]|uniref:glycoside hydrolase family 16 protein n=1 Tax=uncultured Sunxiuqinia sp. TaxID=1573825 RepID=UPI002628FB51|nr:glycoside hydrolase family 16 protein [uncultured Sunxiuqinia sp.]
MSLKLFLLNTFGGIKATSKIESQKDSLWKDYHVFVQVEQSDELKEFLLLEEKVKSGSFKKAKAQLKKLKFKGSSEERQLKQFNKLKRNKRLQQYLQVADSADLKRYENLKEGNDLDRYFELERIIQQGAGASEEESKALREEFKQLKASADVQFFLKYPNSAAYKNYLHMQKSEERRTFNELKAVIESDEFKERKNYLEDPKKWEKSQEHKEEQRYLELKNKPEIQLYQKYKNTNALDFPKNWELVFEDQFENTELDRSKWKTINYWAEKTVGKNFSQHGDLQAFADGKNVQIAGERLRIQVKKEKRKGLVWNPVLGFVEKEMDYSSDSLTTGGIFEAQYGILEAKIKYNPDKNFQDVFYLGGEQNGARLNLFECGAKSQFGLSASPAGQAEANFSLSGLSAGKLYIFSMVWEKGKLSWKINDKELFAVNSNVPDYPMFLNLTSLVIQDSQSVSHQFDVDWVRFYQKRKS